MVAENIKALRSSNGWTQSELAKKLGITRSSVNAWEMGISVPSTAYIVELAQLFHVSTDFLLGLKQNASIDISGLSEEEVKILNELVQCFRKTTRK
ncbi:helix-turn-helix domain-containing protein [Faecalimonas umbilicata]|nr:helix-turn-helix domain-containing protein [Faecalimonas umbilicata]